MEGQSQPAGLSLEELPQQINGQSLEKVQQYYRKLRTFYLERSNLPTDSNTTAVKIDQLIRPINAMDELCRLMKSFINTKPTPSGYSSSNTSGAGLLPISSELCYRLGACQITMCGTGMQRSTLSVSLEQAAILARSHGLLPKCIMQATDIMRKQVSIRTCVLTASYYLYSSSIPVIVKTPIYFSMALYFVHYELIWPICY
uniref:Uncharacterized protein n=1 Tax=Meleagris gallopavo TaxID=9103 RepID=A0A803XNC6_MELGA